MAISKVKSPSAFQQSHGAPTDPSRAKPLQEGPSPAAPEQLATIPLNQLERNPSQPRSMADEEKLEELVTSIVREGLIQPIAVLPTSNSSYQIIAGHRRVAAFQRLYERTKGTDRQRQYEAIPAIIKGPLDAFRMATTAFVENDKRERLNLVDEAGALTKIRDILSTRLGRQATAKEVADAVEKKDEQRVSRLFRLHEAPDVVKEGVIGQPLVAKNDDGHGSLLPVVKTSTKAQKTLDLVAALEFSRLHKYLAVRTPEKANEKTKRIIDRARDDGWSVRRIQAYVKAVISVKTKQPNPLEVFSNEQGRLTVHLSRLSGAPAEVRARLYLRLQSILDELDRLREPGGAQKPATPSSAPPGAINVD